MITLTPNAAEVVRSNINSEKLSVDTALRLGVKNDGCKDSGTQYRYVVELDSDAIRPDDHLFESEGIRIRVDRKSLAHLDGLRQGPNGVEFMFLNPRAKHSCGCGHTFAEETSNTQGKGAGANK
ncbi:MAG TPA: iron-sulfur cluster assembly accessory protein [Candidatus Acidoferrum sp.]|nr:iron-sulfur cluster assembly accessory protein [Candidatus Acidoferrum sp.]